MIQSTLNTTKKKNESKFNARSSKGEMGKTENLINNVSKSIEKLDNKKRKALTSEENGDLMDKALADLKPSKKIVKSKENDKTNTPKENYNGNVPIIKLEVSLVH